MELGAHLMAANQSKEDLKTSQASIDSCKERLESLNERIAANEAKVYFYSILGLFLKHLMHPSKLYCYA